MKQSLQSKAVTIPAGASGLSGEVALGDADIVGFRIGSAWVAAALTLQIAEPNIYNPSQTPTYLDVYTSGSELSISVAADREIRLTDDLRAALRGVDRLKLRSGTSATPVNQTGGATIDIVYYVTT